MSEIFISYAREDRPFAQELAASLEEEGWSVWWDRSIPTGRRYHKVIEDALAAARCIIVVWSQHSVGSDWVRAEAGEGMARDVLAPVAIDTARPPLVFRQLQIADLSAWKGDNAATEFRKLVRDIGAIAPPSATAEKTAPAAPASGSSEPSDPGTPAASQRRAEPAPAGSPAATAPAASESKPEIVRFYAFPSYIQKGRSSTLTWSVKGADSIEVDGRPQERASGTLDVQPARDTTYRLAASNSAGETTADVDVTVRPGRS